jgi:hypothetical protein
MTLLKIDAGSMHFLARLEEALAPQTCALFCGMLPFEERFIHVRWSGEACWVPMGTRDIKLPWENNTSYPTPGQIIFYPGGISETEILLAYGSVQFASKVGVLAGNHFLTIVEGQDRLSELGRLTLWQGAQAIKFRLA